MAIATEPKDKIQHVDEALVQIKGLKTELSKHLKAAREQREQYPRCEPYAITEKSISQIYDHFQTVRDRGERIDYNTVTTAMTRIDDLLEKLHAPVQFRRTDILGDLSDILDTLETTIKVKARKS
jgi:cell fate (sporulation/competence/biofilm development) regulator YlbF (YheA/YmcA/DUF963 family)